MYFFDANVFLAIFGLDAGGQRRDLLAAFDGSLVSTSDFVLAEFASGLARRYRIREADKSTVEACLALCDDWTSEKCRTASVTSDDIRVATAYLRRLDLDLNLRTPDAVNIATTARLGVTLVTFDRRMAIAARALGVFAVEP